MVPKPVAIFYSLIVQCEYHPRFPAAQHWNTCYKAIIHKRNLSQPMSLIIAAFASLAPPVMMMSLLSSSRFYRRHQLLLLVTMAAARY